MFFSSFFLLTSCYLIFLYQIALLLILMIYLCSLLNLLTQSYHMQMMSFVSFLIFMPFGSFYYITVLVRTSSTMLKRSVNSRHSCCFPDLKRKCFQYFSMSDIYGRFFFHQFRRLSFVKNINHDWMFNFIRQLFCMIKIITWFSLIG